MRTHCYIHIMILAFVMLIALSGCQSDNNDTQSQIDELRSQLDEAQSKIQELEQVEEQDQEEAISIESGLETTEQSEPDRQNSSEESETTEPSMDLSDADTSAISGTVAFNLNSNSQKSITASSSFVADADQTLTIEVQSTVQGGTVDFFLFSPSHQEHRFTFSGNETQMVNLTSGTWAYNCTGFFDSGEIVITGMVQ